MEHRVLSSVFTKMGVISVPATTTVQAACSILVHRDTNIVFVTENNTIVGSFTEHDLVKVVAQKLDPESTPLRRVMVPLSATISPLDTTDTALAAMHNHGVRHLPVEVNGEIIAVLSMQELYECMRLELEDGMRRIRSYVNGDVYGMTA
ncbi:MAG: CBS domain-containing protein [Alphaproteobacteria bacterium]|nr:CBS domain-containing protein [Alphaproteobacteria bacterium]